MTQGLLLGVTGTHHEPTGSDAKGPALEVCDACRCDIRWNPGTCPTPGVHTYRDPLAGEEGADVNEAIRAQLTQMVVQAVELDGEFPLDGARVETVVERLLGAPPFEEYPEDPPARGRFIADLIAATMRELGGSDGELPKVGAAGVVQREGWDPESGNDIRPPPLPMPAGGPAFDPEE